MLCIYNVVLTKRRWWQNLKGRNLSTCMNFRSKRHSHLQPSMISKYSLGLQNWKLVSVLLTPKGSSLELYAEERQLNSTCLTLSLLLWPNANGLFFIARKQRAYLLHREDSWIRSLLQTKGINFSLAPNPFFRKSRPTSNLGQFHQCTQPFFFSGFFRTLAQEGTPTQPCRS